MAFGLAWLRLDARRRWRSLVVLALLIAVASGTVLAAAAGARRGETAMSRLAGSSRPATLLVTPNQPGFDWAAVRALPQVEGLATIALGVNIPVDGLPPEAAIQYVPGDALDEVARPVLLRGRLADPRRPDEVIIQPEFVARYHRDLGDVLTARLFSPEQVARFTLDSGPPRPQGPVLPLRIVGVARTVDGELLDVDTPQLYPTPALFRQYRANFFGPDNFVNALVRLRGGEADLPGFEAGLARVSGRSDIDARNLLALQRRAQLSFSFQARCLLAFAIAVLLASLVLIGQAVARYAAGAVADLQVLRALGMTPRQAVQAACTGPLAAGLAGAGAGVAGAVLASRWFPIGSAARMEPAPGLRVDWPVLGAGAVAVPLAVLAGAAAAAWLAQRAQLDRPAARRSAVVAAAGRAGLPVPVLVGARLALEPGSGRTAVPARPALVGAIAGVLGVIGAFTFASGVADATAHPERFGQTWQLVLFTGWGDQEVVPQQRRVLEAAARDPDVSGIDDARVGIAHTGAVSVSLFTVDPVGSPVGTVLTAGRPPRSAAEVVLAPTTASGLHARPGDRLVFTGAQGRRRELTVSGIGFVPVGPHNDYDSGGWVGPGAFGALFGDGFKFRFALLALRPGADPGAVAERLNQLERAVTGVRPDSTFGPAGLPSMLAELRQVGVLPLALGVFLALLAVGAVGHALATAVRRRRVDVAVLRALGMTRGQSRLLVATQASVLAAVGLLFGVPLGLATGRTLWRVEADYAPLAYVPPLAVLALLLVGPAALLAANLLAAWPGRQAAGLRIGAVLRAE